MKINFSLLFRSCLIFLCAFLFACASSQRFGGISYDPLIDTMLNPQKIQAAYGFETHILPANNFMLFSLLRPASTSSDTLKVYIEGDGLAWITRTRPSKDPTPTVPVAFNLARADSSKSASLYLARPCQYIMKRPGQSQAKACEQKYWTMHRYSWEVVHAMNKAVDRVKEQVGAKKVALVGYSGGGAIVALMASERRDVAFIGSVAGNLDHLAWTQHHRVSPLRSSANPLDIVEKIRHIPQKHLSGKEDDVVPFLTQENFCSALPKDSCVEVEDMKHNSSWEKVFDNYMRQVMTF